MRHLNFSRFYDRLGNCLYLAADKRRAFVASANAEGMVRTITIFPTR